MEFQFSENQKLLQDEARKFLASRCSIKTVRAILDGPEPYDRDLWAALAEMGFLGTTIPEQYGGSDAGFLELCVIAEEIGRSLAPVPFASSIYLAATLLLEAGSEAQKLQHLSGIASGKTIACVALFEGVGQQCWDNAEAKVEGGKLSGVKLPVLDGDVAHLCIVLAQDGEGPDQALSLYLVDLRSAGVSCERLATIDPTRSQARVTFDAVECERLGEAGRGPAALERAVDRAAVLIAFEQVGGADRALEMARDYALERVAFGRVIASFQAIKHKLVDMYIATVLARSNAYYGAWAASSGSDQLGLAAAAARMTASHAFRLCSTEGCHIFGAMGYTWEADCHLYFRRARLLGLVLGSDSLWGNRLVERMKQERPAV